MDVVAENDAKLQAEIAAATAEHGGLRARQENELDAEQKRMDAKSERDMRRKEVEDAAINPKVDLKMEEVDIEYHNWMNWLKEVGWIGMEANKPEDQHDTFSIY